MNLFVRNFRYWLPALLWLAVIAIESFFLSSNVTGSWLWSILRALHIPMSWSTFNRLHHILRKGGHVTGYGILCLLVFRACYHSLAQAKNAASQTAFTIRGLRSRCAGLALGTTLATAILDEWHQSFDPTRTSSVWDVGLDVIGGVIFLSIALFLFKLWRETPISNPETVSA